MKYVLILLYIAFCLTSCGGSKKQSLVDESTVSKDIKQADSVIFTKGVKLKESRTVNSAHPPVILDYSNPVSVEKELDISQYYNSVKYVKLKHPQTEEGKNQFFTPVGMTMMGGEGMAMLNMYPYLQTIVTDNHILAGDPFYGLHLYDKSGNYLQTLTTMENPPKFQKKGFRTNISDSQNMLAGVQVVNDICMFTTLTRGETTVNLYDLNKQENLFSKRIQIEKGYPLDHNIFANYNYNPASGERKAFIHTFNVNGDTLCKFMNNNILPKDLGATVQSIAYRNDIYYYDNKLTIRQSGNDTIYRFVAANKLEPAYIFNFGKYKSDIEDLLKGNNSGKIVPESLVETDKLILFTYTENKQKRYSIFDKFHKKVSLFSKINNTLQDGIPFDPEQAKSRGKGLYCMYTKNRLKILMDENPQHEKIKSLYNELQENELLIMILE